MSNISWQYPWLLLLALQPFILILVRYLSGRKRLNAYASPHLKEWVISKQTFSLRGQLLSRDSAYIIAWLLFAIAAAGPRTQAENPDVVTSSGTDLMVVLDISRSMHTADLNPSRLRHAKNKIARLVSQLRNERLGIIVFAGRAHVYVPMTRDRQALNFYTQNIDLISPPSQGSRPDIALQLAYSEFSKLAAKKPERSHAILLMSDGDLAITSDHNEPLPALTELIRSTKIPLYTIGFGSNDGDAVPDYTSGWITNNNIPVISRLNSDLLQSFSTLTGGKYFKANQDNAELESILAVTRQHANHSRDSGKNNSIIWNELYRVFLLPGILMFFISFNPYSVPLPSFALLEKARSLVMAAVVVSLLVFATVHPNHVKAESPTLTLAYKALQNNDYTTAQQHYAETEGFAGRFGEGVVSYRLEEYPRAIRFFSQAILEGHTDQQRGDALYNLANSLFQVGNYAEAIEGYQDALRYTPANLAAGKNLVYAERAKLAVEDRQRILAITKRAGRGPREGATIEGIELNASNKVSIDDSQDKPEKQSAGLDTGNLDIPEILILKGLDYAAKEAGTPNLNPETSVSSVQRKLTINTLNKLHDNQANLWNRIFELEEGYPAPLDKPATLLGVDAW